MTRAWPALAAAALGCACDFGYHIGTWPDAAPDVAVPDGGEAACPSATVNVPIRAMSFQPVHLTVAVGTRVVWINEDTVDHDVTEGDPGDPTPDFASGALRPGDSWSYDFCEPAVWTYHCSVHPNTMRDATVTVEAP